MKRLCAIATFSFVLLAGCSGGSEPQTVESVSFGSQVVFESGLELTVSKPMKYEPSPSAYIERRTDSYKSFDVSVVNKTDAAYDVGSIYFNATADGGHPEEIFDSAQEFEGVPGTTLKPGAKTEFKVAFSEPNRSNLKLNVVVGDKSGDNANYVS